MWVPKEDPRGYRPQRVCVGWQQGYNYNSLLPVKHGWFHTGMFLHLYRGRSHGCNALDKLVNYVNYCVEPGDVEAFRNVAAAKNV